jgi:hypothetical protein
MKIFRMNEFDWVCSKDMESAIEWYEKQTGEPVDLDEVRECDLEKEGQYIDLEDEARIAELEAEGILEEKVPVDGKPHKSGF